MADDQHESTRDDARDGVRLVSPDGEEVTVRNPEAVNNLVYGRGYKPIDDDSPEDAVQVAAQQAGSDRTGAGDGTAAPSVVATKSATPKSGGKTPVTD